MAVKSTKSDTKTFHSGAISSNHTPAYHLIPLAALNAYARRLERGKRIKGEGAWNAMRTTDNYEKVLQDKEFIIDRLSHCIQHCYTALGRISGQLPPLDEQERLDGGDAGAIMFAGGLLAAMMEYEDK